MNYYLISKCFQSVLLSVSTKIITSNRVLKVSDNHTKTLMLQYTVDTKFLNQFTMIELYYAAITLKQNSFGF